MKKLLLISAVVLLSGCQSTKQNYQIVNTSDLLPVIHEQFHFALTDHEKFRKVSLTHWNCYIPDEKIDDVFFCADGNNVVYLTSRKSRPDAIPDSNKEHIPPSSSSEDHAHPDTEDHAHPNTEEHSK